jgi:DNA (cytosine-5)-methyltransferase 1
MSFMKINQLDLFSGIGGFHLGFERAGYEVTSYFSEIDQHAIAVYKHQFPTSTYVGSVTNVRGADLPRIDLITFGSPCQDFSLAGKRLGMDGQRSSLVLEAIRLISECRPSVFVWENVKGTFSSNDGADFWAIIQAFTDIGGYRLEWQLLNTSWFLPQNRERIYLVGYSTTTGGRGVFPIAEGDKSNPVQRVQIVGHRGTGGQQGFIYGEDGIAATLNACSYKDPMKVQVLDKRGNHKKGENASTLVAGYYKQPSDGDYLKVKQIGTRLDSGGKQPYQQDRVYDADGHAPALNAGKSDLILRVKSATSSGHEEATSGDSINLSQPNSETRRGRVGKQKAQTLETSCNQAVVQPNYTSKALNETIENSDLVEGEPQALDLYNRVARSESPTLTEPHHNSLRMFDGYRIRRLTPIECERLQGFPDDHTAFGNYDGAVKPMSNTQRYKQCGNAVTVDVVAAVAKNCLPLFKTNQQ